MDEAPARRRRAIHKSDLFMLPCWCVQALLYALAPTSLLLRLARLEGWLTYRLTHEGKRRTRLFRTALQGRRSEDEIRVIARRNIEFLKMLKVTRLWPSRRDFARALAMPVHGYEHVEEALKQGKGVLLLGTHSGYGRLLKHIVRSRGARAWLLADPQAPDADDGDSAFADFVRYRLLRIPKFDNRTDADLPTGLNVRPVVQALARNEVVFVTLDGRRTTQRVEAEILGARVAFTPGPLSIARATGAVALPAFVFEEPGTVQFTCYIDEPLSLADGPAAAVEQFARVSERYILRYPHDLAARQLRAFARPERRQRRDTQPLRPSDSRSAPRS